MINNPNYTHKVFSSRVKVPATQYVGDVGRIFYNESTGELRLSDGQTPGGLPIYTNSTSLSLSGLQDVSINSAIAGQSLVFNGSTWVNSNSVGSSSTLSTLLDVDITAPSLGQALVFNGNNWANLAVTTLVADTLSIPPSNSLSVDTMPVDASTKKTVKWNVVVSTLTKTQSFELHSLITESVCKWTKIAILGDAIGLSINISITNSIAELSFYNSENTNMTVEFVRLST